MQIVTTAVIKGGTGKTTTAAALAQAAAAAGRKVLAIDLDPQCNLTYSLAADQTKPGIYEVLHGTPAKNVLQMTAQGVATLAAAPNLATEKTTPGSAKRLQTALEPLTSDFDFCVIDTPPTMSELTYNALQAATGLIIPLEADRASLQGLYNICDIATQMQRSNPRLHIIGTVITRFDARPNINRFLLDTIADKGEQLGAPLLMTIRPGIAIREAQAMQQSIFEYAPQSNPAQDYKKLYEMIQEAAQ